MPSNHLVLGHPLLLLRSIFPSIRVFSKESVLHLRWSEYWSFSISPFDELQWNLWISFSWASLNQSLLLDPWLWPGWWNTLPGIARVTHSLTSCARGRKLDRDGGLSPKLRCYDPKKGEYPEKRKTFVLFSGVTTPVMLCRMQAGGPWEDALPREKDSIKAPLWTLHDKPCRRNSGRCLYFLVNHS